MAVNFSVRSVIFNNGARIDVGPSDIVVLVGPNNSGKSATLRDITSRLQNDKHLSPIVTSVGTFKEGSSEELLAWLGQGSRITGPQNDEQRYEKFGAGVIVRDARDFWGAPTESLGALHRFFVAYLNADSRLGAANPPQAINILDQAPNHPIHYLYAFEELESKISKLFKQAFGVDAVVNRGAGGQIPIHVGEDPVRVSPEDRVSRSYLDRLRKLPLVHSQGDGMRSYMGVLLNTLLMPVPITLLDEPEAFLHPPQARLLGYTLARELPANHQLFIGTHSGDFLRGLLDAGSERVRVVRIRREGNQNPTRELVPGDVRQLWADPILRQSNVLDGLFHEKVLVCESDGDCRFFGAVTNALGDSTPGLRRPDVMFVHGGGKDRIPLIVKALRSLNVPVRAVADFDVFNDEHPLCDIVTAFGGNWHEVAQQWRRLKTDIDAQRPDLNAEEVTRKIAEICAAVGAGNFPKSAARKIQAILRQASPWAHVKRSGKTAVPAGDAYRACEFLLDRLAQLGVFVVEVGELEGFVRSVGGKGPAWVVNVLQNKDLLRDSELDLARNFVTRLIA